MKKVFILCSLLLMSVICRAQLPTGTWSGAIDVQGNSLTLVFHISDDGCKMDVPDQGAKGIAAAASLTPLGALHIDIAAIGASFEGFRLGEKIIGTFTQYGSTFPLTLVPGVSQRKRPQTPQPPFPYATEEVSFSNGDAVLKGTLVLPEGFSRQTPVLLMVTGSGLQNRDEELFEHKPFAVIADYLARRGFATLRYDDRGFGESTGDVIGCTTEDLKEDAAAGVAFLRQRFDHVGVLGHSEGGTIALMLAAEQKADFIVSLAGMVVSGRETLLAQNRHGLQQAGLDEETTDRYCQALTEIFDAVTDGTSMPSPDRFDLPAALKQNLSAVQAQLGLPYLRCFIQLDMTKRLGDITCPVLALNGTLDTQVDCDANLGALQHGLPASEKHLVRASCEGLNHLFQHAITGEAAEYPQIEETIAPEVLALIAEWLVSSVWPRR